MTKCSFLRKIRLQSALVGALVVKKNIGKAKSFSLLSLLAEDVSRTLCLNSLWAVLGCLWRLER